MCLDLRDQVDELLALAFADIEKENANLPGIVNGLGYAGEAKWQSVQVKLDLRTMVNPDRKTIIGAELASVQTQIQDAAAQPNPWVQQVQDCRAIYGVSGFLAAFGPFRWRGARVIFRCHS